MMSRFPAAFRPPAFASWSSCARQGAGPSLRSAYRSCCQGRHLTGLPRSARMSCGRGGCPLYPGDCGARTAGRSSPAAARRLAAACPCTPVQQPTTGGFLSRGIIKGSRSFTRPAFPSPVAPGGAGALGLVPPGLHTPPLPAAHAGVGTDIVGTCLSYVTISWSSSQRNHSPRATSCRTDLIRACVPSRTPIPVLSVTRGRTTNTGVCSLSRSASHTAAKPWLCRRRGGTAGSRSGIAAGRWRCQRARRCQRGRAV